jgi:ribosomal protein L11 methyltransferase
MAWLQISVEVSGDQVDEVSEAFNSIGALSVTVLDAGDEPLLEPAPGEAPLWSNTRIVAMFDAAQDSVELKQQLLAVLEVPLPDFLVETLADRDWSNTWRETFGAMRFGERLWVCPVGEPPSEAGAIVVHMDPGMAFGTGTHATTAMCLHWLDAHPPVNRSVIDYGCGSGILAIAAHKLAAANVTAVDIDPQALLATRENARRNDCDFEVLHPEALGKRSADLVVANILANPLIELAEGMARRVHAGGRLILTGILAEQAEAVMAAYVGWFVFAAPVYREEWVLLEGLKTLDAGMRRDDDKGMNQVP